MSRQKTHRETPNSCEERTVRDSPGRLNCPESRPDRSGSSCCAFCAKVQPLSCILVKRQLKLFARIAILPNAKDLRGIVFNDNSFTKPQCGPRRRGRPRVCWIDEMHKLALRIAGSHAHLSSLLSQCKSSMKPWLDAVHTDFSQSNIE